MKITTGIKSSVVRRNGRYFKAGRSYQHDGYLFGQWPGPRPPAPEGGGSFRPADMSYATTMFERRRSENIAEAVDVH